MNKFLPFVFLMALLALQKATSQTVIIQVNPSRSSLSVLRYSGYHASENISLESEIGASGYISPATAKGDIYNKVNHRFMRGTVAQVCEAIVPSATIFEQRLRVDSRLHLALLKRNKNCCSI